MVQYRIYYTHPHRHFISFEAAWETQGKPSLDFQLPAWRPGRYELGNFSKNIKGWRACDEAGNELPFTKINKDLWRVQCADASRVVVHYQYYASELNAGSSYLSPEMLYINPVNCFFYEVTSMNAPYELRFDLPDDYEIACGLSKKSEHILLASNFDQLADCPLIASNSMKHLLYKSHGVDFHIHIQGEILLDDTRLLREFQAFTDEQMTMFGSIPCSEYHFLFHFLPHFVRHGVEHSNSTVIAMGPAADFQQEHLFKDLLGISCHELFHTWNIKCIRPIEMMPYDFTSENYSHLGYVAEGVTTYYGDYLLWKTASFTDTDWLEVLSENIQTHLDTPGRFNHSVRDSSFDTWLDGYGPGIPWRKVSIYNEGFLIALICDVKIMLHSNGIHSLDHVMRDLYSQFGAQGKGYSEEDYLNLLRLYAGPSIQDVIDKLIFGKEDYVPYLQSCLAALGLQWNESPSPKLTEAYFGMSLDEAQGRATVLQVAEGSPADLAGLWIGDEIVAVNGTAPYKNMQWLSRMQGDAMVIQFMRKNKLHAAYLNRTEDVWMKKVKLTRIEKLDDSQARLINLWQNR